MPPPRGNNNTLLLSLSSKKKKKDHIGPQNGYYRREDLQSYLDSLLPPLGQWRGPTSTNPEVTPFLSRCASLRALGPGKLFHALLSSRAAPLDVVAETSLLYMYGKCGQTRDARLCFDLMLLPNIISCNAMISVYAQYGHVEDALELYYTRMGAVRGAAIKPTVSTYLSLLHACANSSCLESGRKIHLELLLDGGGIGRVGSKSVVGNGGIGGIGSDIGVGNAGIGRIWPEIADENAGIGRIGSGIADEHAGTGRIGSEIAGGNAGIGRIRPETVVENAGIRTIGSGIVAENSGIRKIGSGIAGGNAGIGRIRPEIVVESAGIGRIGTGDFVAKNAGIGRVGYDIAIGNAGIGRIRSDIAVGNCGIGRIGSKSVIGNGGIGRIGSEIAVDNAAIQTIGSKIAVENAGIERIGSEIAGGNAGIERIGSDIGVGNAGIGRNGSKIAFGNARIGRIGSNFVVGNPGIGRIGSDIAVGNALVDMYGKCGSLLEAQEVFDGMQRRNVISWTAMIGAYAHNGAWMEAFATFKNMGCNPNRITFLVIIEACSNLSSLQDAQEIHRRLDSGGIEMDEVIESALIRMYGKCGSPSDAWLVFTKMSHPSVISWNSMIAAFSHNGLFDEALDIFWKMGRSNANVKPDLVTFLAALEACSGLKSLENGRSIHKYIITNGFAVDAVVGSALINMYGKCGSLDEACRVFDGMKQQKNVVSWTAMIAAYAQNGHMKQSLNLFEKMISEGVKPDKVAFLSALDACVSPDSLTNARSIHEVIVASGVEFDISMKNALIDAYGKCGSLIDARVVFEQMQTQNIISWTAMISTLAGNGRSKEALELFWHMESVKPDAPAFLSILDACGRLSCLESCRAIHGNIVASGIELDVVLETALIQTYGKCNSLKDAKLVFSKMVRRNVVSWNSMIAAYIQNGQGREALELFRKMDSVSSVKPDKITFLNLLDACASLTSVDYGKFIHKKIVAFGLGSDVAVMNALINMYGKCGSLIDAKMVFDNMPRRDLISWNSMIATYAQNGYEKGALNLFQCLELEADRITFINILNSCSHAGLMYEGWCYFLSMHEDMGLTPGVEHYACMIDLVGRAGCYVEAQEFFNNMPTQLDVMWMAPYGFSQLKDNKE